MLNISVIIWNINLECFAILNDKLEVFFVNLNKTLNTIESKYLVNFPLKYIYIFLY